MASAREMVGIGARLWPLFVHLRLHYQLMFLSPLFVWGFLLAGARFSGRAALGFLAFHVFLYGGITAYNSYYDRDEGPVGGLRSPPPVQEALLGFSLAVQGVGLAFALYVGALFTALYLLVMALSFAYSHPSLRWKARPLLSLLVVALGQGAVGFWGGWLCGVTPATQTLGLTPLLGLGVAMLSTVGFYPLTQLYQVDEDRARGDITFAVRFGADACFRFALLCLALAGACIVPLVWLLFGAPDALFLTVVYLALLATIARWRGRFRAGVEANFVALHRLQFALSVGTLGYMLVRLAVA